MADRGMDLRVMLARLLESLEAAHTAQTRAISDLRAVIKQVDESGMVKPPPAWDMIVQALRGTYGLSRAEIIDAIRRDYGVDVPANTITGTLARMRMDNEVFRRGQVWVLRIR
jgi:hypothetical protein